MEGGGDLEIRDRDAAYTAEYRIATVDGPEVRRTSERVVVRRPWSSRLEQFDAETPGGGPTVLEVGSFGLRLTGTGPTPLIVALPPGMAPADVRLDTLAEVEQRGFVDRRERRRLDGRECQVLRTADGLFASALTAAPSDDADHIDTCVTADGITVEEAFVQDGRISRIRTLTSYEPVAAEVFAIDGEPVGASDGGGSIQRLTDSSAYPGTMLEAPAPPSGFTKRGRYAVVPPQAENFTDPTREGAIVAGVADVYERGLDAVVVDQGGTLRGVDPFPAPAEGATTLDLGPLGRAEVFVSLRMNELRLLRTGGRYLRVYGTLPITELEAFARTLEERPGGQLTPDPSRPL